MQKMTELQREKHELFVWAKEQQERQLHEIRKLTRALGRTRKSMDEHVRTRGGGRSQVVCVRVYVVLTC